MNHYNEVPGILETGCEKVSPHLRWLIRNAVLSTCPPEAVNLIAYNENVPDAHFGIAHGPSRSISINLERHFFSALDRCMDETNMYASIRMLLLHELLDTVRHEAYHLKISFENNDFNKSDLDEAGAKEAGSSAWSIAKKWNCNITHFGEYLDTQIKEFLEAIEEDTKETPVMWKDLQVWMSKNNLGYYNPDKDLELSINHAFEALSNDEEPWLEEPAEFLDTTIEETEKTQPEMPAAEAVPAHTYDSQMPIHAEPTAMEAALLSLAQNQPNLFSAALAGMGVQTTAPSMGDSYPEYNDEIPDSFESAQAPAPTPVMPVMPVMPTAPAGNLAKTIETVFRTIFWHVVSKGEFTHEGGYNNPGVVMEPISIAHIPGALQIFTNMDTLDAHGKYAKNQPTQYGIKGMLTKENLPKYTLFLNINGQLHRRSLVAQNPNAVDDMGQLKTWAREAKAGSKIMYVLGDQANPGVRASIKLAPGQVLGQEEYKLWT